MGLQPVPILNPSPSYPAGQKQLKLPCKFRHVCVTLQGLSTSHSSISEDKTQKIPMINIQLSDQMEETSDEGLRYSTLATI